MAGLLLNLAALLIAAFVGGLIVRRLGYPAVVGELLVGSVIGPYALGVVGDVEALRLFAELGAIVLLFYVGLETELVRFIRGLRGAVWVAVLADFTGFAFTCVASRVMGFTGLEALSLATITFSTSVGISARVLKDMDKLHTNVGELVVGAAVVDSVLAIVLASVVMEMLTATLKPLTIAALTLKAVVFWFTVLIIGSAIIARILTSVTISPESMAVILIALAFTAAHFAEDVGLPTIIGALAMGMALSGLSRNKRTMTYIQALYAFFVPIFFVSSGMMVDWRMFGSKAIAPSLALTAVLVAGTFVGCLAAAYVAKLSWDDAFRLGAAMTPRGETCLVIASVMMARGLIGNVCYSVSIIMITLTTVVAPIMLKYMYKVEPHEIVGRFKLLLSRYALKVRELRRERR